MWPNHRTVNGTDSWDSWNHVYIFYVAERPKIASNLFPSGDSGRRYDPNAALERPRSGAVNS